MSKKPTLKYWKKLTLKAKANLKTLAGKFTGSHYNDLFGIVDYEQKVLTTRFKVYKVTLAHFKQDDKQQSTCNPEKTYAITDLNDTLLYIEPNIYVRTQLKPQNINSSDFIIPAFREDCVESFSQSDLEEFNGLKNYIESARLAEQEKELQI